MNRGCSGGEQKRAIALLERIPAMYQKCKPYELWFVHFERGLGAVWLPASPHSNISYSQTLYISASFYDRMRKGRGEEDYWLLL